jgi:hypothetical protein
MVPYQIMNTQTLDMVTKISTIAIRDLVWLFDFYNVSQIQFKIARKVTLFFIFFFFVYSNLSNFSAIQQLSLMTNLDLYLALTAFSSKGSFACKHLPWHGMVISERPLILAFKCQAVVKE